MQPISYSYFYKYFSTSPGKLFLAGSLAGATSQSLTYPLDLARARLAVTMKHEYATLRQVDKPHQDILYVNFINIPGIHKNLLQRRHCCVLQRVYSDNSGCSALCRSVFFHVWYVKKLISRYVYIFVIWPVHTTTIDCLLHLKFINNF